MANGRGEAPVPGFNPLQYGLLQMAVDDTANAPDHWRMGINYRVLCPEGGRTWSGCPASSEIDPAGSLPKPELDEWVLRGATPFTVYERFSCPPVGWPEGGLQAAAERAVNRVSSFQVERGFSTGTAGPDDDDVVFPRLQSTAEVVEPGPPEVLMADEATVVDPAVHDPVQAFVLLEGALSECYKGEGYIHVPAGFGSALVSESLIRLVNGRWRTSNNHTVVLGAGYQGLGPDGSDPGVNQTWLYATGQVWFYRGPVQSFELDETLDRSTNTANMLAERTFLVAYDCCLFAQQVNIVFS